MTQATRPRGRPPTDERYRKLNISVTLPASLVETIDRDRRTDLGELSRSSAVTNILLAYYRDRPEGAKRG